MKRKITSLTTAIIVLCVMLIGLPEIGWGQERGKTALSELPNNPTWAATAIGSISDNATVIILSNSNDALPSTTTSSSSPAKKACTVSTTAGVTTITPPNGTTLQDLAWTFKIITENNNTSYKFYQEGSTTVRLYLNSTSDNKALRVGNANSSDDKFVLGSNGNLLKVTTATRYVGPYKDGSDWRTYNSETATNYGSASLTFYVLQAAPAYTITAQSNNTNYGTVSLSGSVITGSPKAGCRYASPAYTVSPANSATVSQNGNAFTVTPSANTTVTINFEEIPSHTLSSAVLPAASGTVTLGSTSILEGATTTATAGAEAGYKFTSWSISGTGASLSSTTDNPTTVTMGTGDATVTANFTSVTTYAIKWSVNGEIQQTDNVEENTAITFPTSITGVPSGYVLKGWVDGEHLITGSQSTAPTYVSEANATANITYYAVMAVGQLSTSTATLELTSTQGYNSSYASQEFTDDHDNTWSGTVAVSTQDDKPCIQLKTGSPGTPITSPTFPGTITKIKMLARNGSTKYARTFNFNSAVNNNNGNLGTLEVPASFAYNSELTATLEAEFDQFYLWVTDNLGFNKIAVTYNETIYSNYCTSVSSQAAISGTIEAGHLTTNGTIEENTVVYINTPLVINSDVTLTVNGALTTSSPTDLIIEEGGQLIIHNDGVQATVKKSVGSVSKDATAWYTIASPVRNISIGAPEDEGNVKYLKDNGSGTPVAYDLYRFDEVAKNWENYKNTTAHADFTTLETGRGYLYRRNDAATLEYKGEVNGTDYEEVTLTKTGTGDFAGFHLIGNPYSHDIYKGAKGHSFAIPNSAETGYSDDYVLSTGFYRLTNDDAWQAQLEDGTKIKSGEGVLVQATTAGTLRVYNSDAKPVSKANNDNIMFKVANSQYEDVAYAWFDKVLGLNKINHRNPEVPMIYINQNDENFAIATMSDDTKVFNLNFKAMTMGKYTLSMKARGSFSYLHIIDKMTGEDIDILIDDDYSFMASPSDSDARFIVKLSYDAGNNISENDVFAYQSGNNIIVSGDGELQVFDVTGRMVATQRVNGVEKINIPSQGVYIFKLNEKVQKIVVR